MKKNKISWMSLGAIILCGILATYGFTNEKNQDNTFSTSGKTSTPWEGNYVVHALPTPEEITFMEKEVPVQILDVKEKLDRELLVNTYWHSNTFLMIKRANRWFPIIEPILKENNIPDDFKYLALIESGLTNVTSSAGATGFWQFLKETGKEYGLEVNSLVDERYHVEKSTVAACKYLHKAYDKFEDWALVAASYNMGMGGVTKRLNEQKVKTYWDLLLNMETARYVYRIIAVKEILTNSEKYGFMINSTDLYQPYQTKTISVETPILNLTTFANDNGINFKTLKTLNPWMRKDNLNFKNNRIYDIKLPIDVKQWQTE